MRYALLVWIIFFVSGCGEGTQRQQPYIMGQNAKGPYAATTQAKSEKIETAKIEAESNEKIAKINMQRDIEVQKLKSSTDVTKATIEKEVAIEEAGNRKIALENEHSFSITLLYIVGIAMVLLFLFFLYYTGKNRKERLKKHEDELLFKLKSKEQELKVHMAEKMLDSIASGKLSPEQETRLIEALENTTGRLIEHKK